MATTAFTLRNTVADGGSGLQRTYVVYPGGASAFVYDSALKSDDYIAATSTSSLQSSFTAEVYQRDQIELSWTLQTALTIPTNGSTTYVPSELLIKVSQYGEPVTPGDGGLYDVSALTTVTSTNYFSSFTDVGRPDLGTRNYMYPGNWVYYSLFVKWKNGFNDSYYDRVAVVSVQIPRDFGSTEELWRLIPTYYKELDNQYKLNTAGYSYPDGPLYRFVELFGWELDKIRTTIYDTMRINDPQVIHSSAIDALANQVGVDLTKDALGTAKLRTVLNNIGKLQRTKGTLGSIEAYISALSGCTLTTVSTTKPIQFNVHPQRVNLVTDPFFKQGVTDTDTTGPVYRKSARLTASTRAHGWGVYVNAPSVTPTIDTSGNMLTITFPAGAGTNNIYIYSRGSFPYNNALTYYASAVSSHDFVLRFVSSTNMTSGLEATNGSESVTFYDSWNNSTAASAFPNFSNSGRKVFGSIPNTTTVTSTNVIPVFYFSVVGSASASTTVTFSQPMVEPRNSGGQFFTGDSDRGGFIPTATNASLGAFDYKWGRSDGSAPNTDFSYYTTDDHRSRKITEYIVDNYIAPVTFMKSYHYVINWDIIE